VAVVLGAAHDGTAQLVASCTNELLERGVTPASILEEAAKAIGGGAGGKGPVAIAGGRRVEGLREAMAVARGRFESLARP
jgi:alanyl-tRNA synthetase